jgi:replicative DNA helicase
MRADGQEVKLGELVLSQEQPLVWSLDDRHRLVPARLLKAFPSGIKPVFRLRLASGREIELRKPSLSYGGGMVSPG